MLKTASCLPVILALMCSSCSESRQAVTEQSSTTQAQAVAKKMNIKIILGSTRKGRTSDKIAAALKNISDKREDITTEILDLNDYNLPFFNDEVPPAMRQVITDPITKKWANKISEGDAFIIVVPEYNAGYPGVLKNALDSLYKEWNNKPVAFVGFSGGPSGGANAIAQLQQVALALKMKPVANDIKVPTAWKAFDEKRNLTNPTIASELNTMIEQLKNS